MDRRTQRNVSRRAGAALKRVKHIASSHDRSRAHAVAAGDKEMLGLSVVPVIALAERRITTAQLDALDDLCAGLPELPTAVQMAVFRYRYWTVVATATRNAIFQTRICSWLLEAREACLKCSRPIATGSEYRQLSRALRAGVGAVEYWLALVEPVLGVTEAGMRLNVHQGSDEPF